MGILFSIFIGIIWKWAKGSSILWQDNECYNQWLWLVWKSCIIQYTTSLYITAWFCGILSTHKILFKFLIQCMAFEGHPETQNTMPLCIECNEIRNACAKSPTTSHWGLPVVHICSSLTERLCTFLTFPPISPSLALDHSEPGHENSM